jgi:hypothetical protein
MTEGRIIVDLFAEDTAHEELLVPLVTRVAQDQGCQIRIRVVSAQGGHARALSEFRLYQLDRLKRPPANPATFVIVAIDANCDTHTSATQRVEAEVRGDFLIPCIPACPDPHVERWYLADLPAFHQVVGVTPRVPASKCERDFYKHLLAQSVVDADHVPQLGGIEFAEEIAHAMDFYRAGRCESSLKHFLDTLTATLKRIS